MEYYSAIIRIKYCHLWQHGEPRGYYIKWNKRKINTVWFHLYVESKKNGQTRLAVIDTENKQLVVTGEVHKGEEIGKRD